MIITESRLISDFKANIKATKEYEIVSDLFQNELFAHIYIMPVHHRKWGVYMVHVITCCPLL